MKIYSPLFIAIRVIVYSLLMFGIAEGIFYDAGHPIGVSYFSENTFTEIAQEIILFSLFVFYLFLGFKWREIQPISNIVSLFFLISFIREFNFLALNWIYPALVVLAILVWLVFRDFKKIKAATIKFFSVPASSWFFSGFLVTYIFSRLLGRSKFWKLMYHDESYRLAKAATEEGIELLGDTLMLIGAIEFAIYYLAEKRVDSK
ncbi:MAG: hypothetical protein GQ525_08530 [Draconibacterium sp.]|nr:hypothetical protein [Draconibacterium sp.]